MAVLADLERFLEQLFERTSARVFRTRFRPVQLEQQIERAMERGRVSVRGRTSVPDQYRLRLHPSDLAALADGGLEELATDLAEAALRFARDHGFQLADRPRVVLLADPSVASGTLGVDARMRRPDEPPDVEREPAPAPAVHARGTDDPTPSRAPERPVAAGIRDATDATRTLVYRRPVPDAPRAILREVRRDGSEREIEVDGAILTIGRGRDNGLVLEDPRVSRHHGRLQARLGTLVYTDLGSTNGTRVNGLAVDEIVLGPGDRIELGNTTLVVEALPG